MSGRWFNLQKGGGYVGIGPLNKSKCPYIQLFWCDHTKGLVFNEGGQFCTFDLMLEHVSARLYLGKVYDPQAWVIALAVVLVACVML